MGMWMVTPAIIMCRSHLLGEHVEGHMIDGCIRKGKSLKGYIKKGLIETRSLKTRHDELAAEIIRRGWKHKSPMDYVDKVDLGSVDRKASLEELMRRCPECEVRAVKYFDEKYFNGE